MTLLPINIFRTFLKAILNKNLFIQITDLNLSMLVATTSHQQPSQSNTTVSTCRLVALSTCSQVKCFTLTPLAMVSDEVCVWYLKYSISMPDTSWSESTARSLSPTTPSTVQLAQLWVSLLNWKGC